MGGIEFAGERALVSFLETVHSVFEDFGGEHLANLYFNLLTNFIDNTAYATTSADRVRCVLHYLDVCQSCA